MHDLSNVIGKHATRSEKGDLDQENVPANRKV